MIFECPALQGVRNKYAALFGCGTHTMQQFMWQENLMGVAHFVMECFAMLDEMIDDDPSNQP